MTNDETPDPAVHRPAWPLLVIPGSVLPVVRRMD